LEAAWRTHSAAHQVAPPATEAQLSDLAVALGQPVPPELRALLLQSNGSESTDLWSWLSAADIAREHETWNHLAATGEYGDVAYDLGRAGVTVPRLVHPGWIPIAHDHGGNHLAIDTVPGPNGTPGQIIEFGADLVDGPFLHADSLLDYLSDRRYPWPEDAEIDHQVRPDSPRPLLDDDVPAPIQSLRLFGLSVVDGATVSRAAGLKMLLINGVPAVDLAGLQELPLQELRLLNIPRLDLGPLAGHPTLRGLSLSGCGDVEGTAALAALPSLEHVELDRGDTILDALATHPRLHRVTLAGTQPLAEKVASANRLLHATPLALHTLSGRA
ncbi:SMI1/KNR4 family protein, partial [Corynebacterium nasicanis]